MSLTSRASALIAGALRARLRASLRAALLLAFILLSLAPSPDSAQVGASRRLEVGDYPLATGLAWRYRTTQTVRPDAGHAGESVGELVLKVLAFHRHGDLSVAALSRTASGTDSISDLTFLVVHAGCVFRIDEPARLGACLAGAPGILDPVAAELKFPIEPGGRTAGSPATRVEEPETLAVPAGRFVALPVRFDAPPDRVTSWVAAGVGVVRYEYTHQGTDDREVWELESFGREAVDTLAIARAVDMALGRLIDQGDFRSRRAALGSDPILGALMGPMTVTDGPELDDGARRIVARGEETSLTLDQYPDGPDRAFLARWRGPGRFFHVFGRAGRPGSRPDPGSPGPLAPWNRPPASPTSLAAALAATREAFLESEHRAPPLKAASADAAAERSMARLCAEVAAAAGASEAATTPEEIKGRLRQEAGAGYVVSRFGNRIQIHDGRLRVLLDVALPDIGVWAALEDEEIPARGAAPRLIRLSRHGARVDILDGGSEPAAPGRIVSLRWPPEEPSPRVLVWSPATGGGTATVSLYLSESGVLHRIWQRSVPGGSLRLADNGRRLELLSDEPDSLLPAFRRIRREIYAPRQGEEPPILISTEMTDPWMATAAATIRALRTGDPREIGRLVRGSGVFARLSATWLSRSSVPVASVESVSGTADEINLDRRVSIVVRRRPGASPENLGDDALMLVLTADDRDRWIVADVVPEHLAGAGSP